MMHADSKLKLMKGWWQCCSHIDLPHHGRLCLSNHRPCMMLHTFLLKTATILAALQGLCCPVVDRRLTCLAILHHHAAKMSVLWNSAAHTPRGLSCTP